MKQKKKRLLPYLLLGVFLAYLLHRAYVLYSLASEPDMTNVFGQYTYVLEHYTESPYWYWNTRPLAMLFATLGLLIGLLCYLRIRPDHNFRLGEEGGSARFATVADLAGFRDKEPTNNMIFSKQAMMGLMNKRLPFDKQLNKNVFVVGLPGDGKTFTYVKPNIMQMNGTYIVTDPKGLLVREVGQMLEENGYQIKVFDLINFTNSNMFNPFHYMDSEMDIDRITEAIVEGTKKSDRDGEDFWTQAKLLLTRSLIGYLYFDAPLSNYEPNLSMVGDMMRHIRETPDGAPSPVEKLFEKLEKRLPGNYACRQWELFHTNFDAETRTSVLSIVATLFSVFDHDAITNLIAHDNMDMDTWNTEKTAVFVAISETNKAYNFLSATFFTVMFDRLTRNADAIIQGKRQGFTAADLLHIQFYFDEFANVGKLPNINEVLASIRSREMSMKIIVQAISQMDILYGVPARKAMINNCATAVFLGTNDEDTMTYFSKRAGKQTITQMNYSEQRGHHKSGSTSWQSHQRDLLTPDEVARIGVDEALVFIAKQNVFKDKKASVFDHPMKDHLANHYQDDNWYHYDRPMTDVDEVILSVRDNKFVYSPDMTDYDQFIQQTFSEPVPSKKSELKVHSDEPFHDQVPVHLAEIPSESSSPNERQVVDLETGEIFEMPPEDEAEEFGFILEEDILIR